MRSRALISLPILLATTAAAAQQSNAGPTYDDLQAVKNAIPQPLAAMPNSETPTGQVPTPGDLTFVPASGMARSLRRTANIVTATDGTWTVSWSAPMVSASPFVIVPPLNTVGGMPVACNVITRSATGATGKCWQASSVAAAALGASLNVFSQGASGAALMVLALEPTQ